VTPLPFPYDSEVTETLGFKYHWQPLALQKHLYEYIRCFPKSIFASPVKRAHGYCDVAAKILEDAAASNDRYLATQIAEEIYREGFNGDKVFRHVDASQGLILEKISCVFETLTDLGCQNIPNPANELSSSLKEIPYQQFIAAQDSDTPDNYYRIIEILLEYPIKDGDVERAFEIYTHGGDEYVWTLDEKGKDFRSKAYQLLKRFECPNLFEPDLQDFYETFLENEEEIVKNPTKRAAETCELITRLMASPHRELDQKLATGLYNKAEENSLWIQNMKTREYRVKAYQALNNSEKDMIQSCQELIDNETQFSMGQGIFTDPKIRAEHRFAMIETILKTVVNRDPMLRDGYRVQAVNIYFDGFDKDVWLINGETRVIRYKALLCLEYHICSPHIAKEVETRYQTFLKEECPDSNGYCRIINIIMSHLPDLDNTYNRKALDLYTSACEKKIWTNQTSLPALSFIQTIS